LGRGYRFHTTGLTHDERGYPVMTAECQEICVHRLVDKIKKNAEKIIHLEKNHLDDAEIVVVSYGISSRVAIPAIEKARKEGMKVGEMRLVTVWPFPEKEIDEIAGKIKGFVVPEINYGQIVYEVERCAHGQCRVKLVEHGGGWVHDPGKIFEAIREVAR
jgi:2-oxoglutarate ferredoxin oxidoreductase subunit alpha